MNWKSSSRLCFALFLTAGGVAGVQAQGPVASATGPAPTAVRESEDGARDQTITLQHRNRRYQLHSADVLELNFPFTPEFNQTVTVQPDGYITLRGVDGIRVVGQTLPEVTSSLQTTYKKIMHDPVVNVELKDFEKPYFIVGGEVGRPGKFDLRDETTATEAVAIAGGLKDSAKHSEVVLFHRVPDGWVQVKKLDMKKMLKNADLTEDAFLQPGDFLYVPKNTLSKIEKFLPTSSLGLYANPGVL
ncbi:MAG TPA: polysaccharide biosynthesis/export family protein [Candidatus Acidoferrum sp.]